MEIARLPGSMRKTILDGQRHAPRGMATPMSCGLNGILIMSSPPNKLSMHLDPRIARQTPR